MNPTTYSRNIVDPHLFLQHDRPVVQVRGDLGVLRAQHLLMYDLRTLKQPRSLGVASLGHTSVREEHDVRRRNKAMAEPKLHLPPQDSRPQKSILKDLLRIPVGRVCCFRRTKGVAARQWPIDSTTHLP